MGDDGQERIRNMTRRDLAIAIAAASVGAVCAWFAMHDREPTTDPRIELMLKDSDARLVRICGPMRTTMKLAAGYWASGQQVELWSGVLAAAGNWMEYCVKVEAKPLADRVLSAVFKDAPRDILAALDELEPHWIDPYFVDMDRASGERPPWR